MTDCVMLDIGGSFVKYSAAQGGAFTKPDLFAIKESGTKEEIIDPILDFLKAHPAARVAVSMPGPMDYDRGISLMTHKFLAIRGISLKDEIRKVLPDAEVSFVHDGVAFLLGEMADGEAKGLDCAAGVMLGTGLGFVICQAGRILVRPVLSPARSLWNLPFLSGIAEDYVSGRAIKRQWTEQTGSALEVKDIASLAKGGDPRALYLFEQTGEHLGRLLTAHLQDLPVDKVIIGGQISKSLHLLMSGIGKTCALPICRAAHPDDAALRGAYAYTRLGRGVLRVIPE